MEPDGCAKGSPQLSCFSENHGNNVILLENNTVAYRKASFANAVTVSERPVLPGEIFLVEIEQTEPGWTGHMRLGLTQLSPTARLPFYSLPDLSNRGDSWICAITKHHNRLRYPENGVGDRRRSRRRGGRACQQPHCVSHPQPTPNSRHSPDSAPRDLPSGWGVAQSNGHSLVSDNVSKTPNGPLVMTTDQENSQHNKNCSTGTFSENSSHSSETFCLPCDTTMHNSKTKTSPPILNSMETPSSICTAVQQIENGHAACSTSGEVMDIYALNEEPFVLSASESATRISNSIKESVSQLLQELALSDEGSPVVVGKTTSDLPEAKSKSIYDECLSSKGDAETQQRTQNGDSNETGSISLSELDYHCCSEVEQVQSNVTLKKNGVVNVSCSHSVSNFVDNARTDENSKPDDESNASLHNVNGSNNYELSTDGVSVNTSVAIGNSRRTHNNDTVSDVVAMTQEEVETSSEQDGSEEQYVSCLARLAVGDHIRTSRGLVPRSALLPSSSRLLDSAALPPLPTDAGSRIGLLYLPRDDNYAEMHYIINGEDQGIFTRLLPYNDAPLHAVVDVYGTTKRVRIIQLYETMSLQAACRAVILQRMVPENIPMLPLPPQLLQYLLASDC